MAIAAGLDQGCPLSGILYNFYNARLGELAKGCPHVLIPGFADNVAIYICAKTFAAAQQELSCIVQGKEGVLNWADQHNCNYAKDKWALVDFTHKKKMLGRNAGLPLRGSAFCIDDEVTVTPMDSMQYLGVILHFKLNWSQQWNLLIKRSTAWTNAVACMMKSKMGTQTRFAWQLYTAVCLPKMLYAAELWATP
jgi:hypothetical protein